MNWPFEAIPVAVTRCSRAGAHGLSLALDENVVELQPVPRTQERKTKCRLIKWHPPTTTYRLLTIIFLMYHSSSISSPPLYNMASTHRCFSSFAAVTQACARNLPAYLPNWLTRKRKQLQNSSYCLHRLCIITVIKWDSLYWKVSARSAPFAWHCKNILRILSLWFTGWDFTNRGETKVVLELWWQTKATDFYFSKGYIKKLLNTIHFISYRSE